MDEPEPLYSARVLEKITIKLGCWEHVRMGVFSGAAQIGEYVRNYPSHGETTFFPFQAGDQWLALYSRHYTATRIMSLPDCKDLGGEEPDGFGFCPVEYLVPELTGLNIDLFDPEPLVANHNSERWATKVQQANGSVRYYWPDDKDHPCPNPERTAAYRAEVERSHAAARTWSERHPFTTRFATWGLVAGCIWGDDSGGWKVQYLDLSRAAEGILKRESRFGYLQLGPGATLKTGVDCDSIYTLNAPQDRQEIVFAVPQRFTVAGRKLGDDESCPE